mmetsp:Transcript_7290/g.11640  ORF Transcript_7290/g.11640 Transcript_7290/m.11640 type:complete len:336 (-) Transcript_7290:33-1040(-)|eukprot:CAMPEP_0203775084 /NCGR_PEP_ID=MMETSP0099_2-20121227/5820_1 /ASSEMBLY_ACC=CAM_ASM_000209 /TAXON_ID=96639 /ORGANISM=" , Strain NY0313808BC1" /LENGTH=335 /DNA_ID=CAMNT_0050673593 /DNA_START=331 /DNA_END=1338 /DNA_ORIENTATION=+
MFSGIGMNPCCVPDPYLEMDQVYKSRIDANDANGECSGKIALESFPVDFGGYTYQGWIAFEQGVPSKPVVLCFPNYAGLKQFDKDQVVFLAQLGYTGLAVDMYKDTVEYPACNRNPSAGSTPEELRKHFNGAFAQMNEWLHNPVRWRELMSEYLRQARKHPAVHAEYAAAIGYCFGGCCVLEMVRNGDNLCGVVPFHGILQSRPIKPFDFSGDITIELDEVCESKRPVNSYNTKCKILIQNAEQDDLVTSKEIDLFREEMKQAGLKDWYLHSYSTADHGWALPPGVTSNAYDEHTDRRSTLALAEFLKELWPEFCQRRVRLNAAGTNLEYPRSKL